MMVADIFMIAISFILLIIFSIVTVLVTRIIKCGDNVLLGMLVFLDITLISKYTLFIIYNL
jgi:hypothetical protein